jgi:hypothetical protein
VSLARVVDVAVLPVVVFVLALEVVPEVTLVCVIDWVRVPDVWLRLLLADVLDVVEVMDEVRSGAPGPQRSQHIRHLERRGSWPSSDEHRWHTFSKLPIATALLNSDRQSSLSKSAHCPSASVGSGVGISCPPPHAQQAMLATSPKFWN